MGANRKVKIDLAAAAEAESVGVLAGGRAHSLRAANLATSVTVIRALIGVLKQAGAATQPVQVGRSSLRLRVRGKQQTLVLQD